MARPRVFVSSTYYDLKHLRSSLENFVQTLGFDATLSEKGKIAYTPDLPLDESCYREVENSDVFVLIVGGRYGSESSAGGKVTPKTFYDRYNSVTRGEYQAALKRNIPIYVLIEKTVQAEYETYLRNKTSTGINYAHVDSVNIFELIEYILGQPRNNPVQQFERYIEIESWLREQWAGLFRELLQRMQGQQQLATLQTQVSQLSELNTTFKRYLEEIVSKIAPDESDKLIENETQRLKDAQLNHIIQSNALGDHLVRDNHVPIEIVRAALLSSKTINEFLGALRASGQGADVKRVLNSLSTSGMRPTVKEDLDLLRKAIGMPVMSDETAQSPVKRPAAGRKSAKSASRP